MKKLLILIFAAVTIVACKSEPTIDYALISGKIDNASSKVINIRGGNDLNISINLSDNGTFADTLQNISSGYYTLYYGRKSSIIYINSGDDLSINIDSEKFTESITFSGNSAVGNNYIANLSIANEDNSIDFKTLYSMEQPEFIEAINKMRDFNENYLEKATNLPKGFYEDEKKRNFYQYVSKLKSYPSAHKFYAKKDEVVLSEEYTKSIENFDYGNEDDFNKYGDYQSIVISHYSDAAQNSDDTSKVFDELIALDDAPNLKKTLSTYINFYIGPSNENNEALYNGVMALSTDEKFKKKLTLKYNKLKFLAKGMPSPVFTDYENRKGGVTSLEDLRGKYVYVDIWATWCGPCKVEIPYLKEVELKYHGKNIEFVSTSIDKAKDHDAWVQMIKDKELGGIQLLADDDWQSKFVKDYAIEGIPRFILIDPNGNIVSADAPRPSDPKLVKMLDELKI